MYSIQHVLWRGVMAISLMAVGGLGAYSAPVGEPAYIACDEAMVVAHAVASSRAVADLTLGAQAAAYRHVQFDTIVVHGTPPKDA